MSPVIEMLNRFAPDWQFHVFHATWQSAAVASVLMLVVLAGRRWPAPLRYGLLMVALAKFAIPPLLSSPVGLLSRVEMEPQLQAWSWSVPEKGTPWESQPAPDSISPDRRMEPLSPVEPVPSLNLQNPAPGPSPSSEPFPANSSPRNPAETVSPPALRMAGWLMAGHLAGAALLACWVLCQFLQLARLSRRATELTEGPVFDLYVSLADRLGLRRRPRLLLLDQAIAPIAFGALRPVVLVSRTLVERLSPEELRTVLGHELAHHRRRDPLVILFQLAILVAWWFNPVLWLLMRQIRKVREDCCDDLLLERALTSSETYCETLLRASRELAQGAVPVGAALGFAESVHPLARRLRRIMDLRLRRHSRLSLVGLLVVLVLAGVLLPGVRSRAGGIGQEEKKGASLEQKGDPKDAPSEQKTGPNQMSPGQMEPRPEWIADFKPSGVLSGRILGEDGKPVVGARIQVTIHGYREILTPEVITDEKGDYSMPAEAYRDGDHILTIKSRDHIGFPYPDGAPIVSLKCDQKTVKHFVLQKACQIEVRIVDEDGQPVEKSLASVASSSDSNRYSVSDEGSPDSSGKIRLGGLQPSSQPYVVMVKGNGYAPGKLLVTLNNPGHVETGEIVMRRGGTVKARVICSDGKPAAGWFIQLEPKWWQVNNILGEYPIDKDGNVTLSHITPDDYSISIAMPIPGEKNGRTVFPVMTATLPPPVEPLEIRVPKPSPPASPASISGTVNLEDSRLTQAVSVVVYNGTESIGGTDVWPGQTNKNFTIDNLAPGLYTLKIVSYADEIREKTIEGVKAPCSDLKIDVEYLGKPHLRGVVLDATTNHPIPQFKVRWKKLRPVSSPRYSDDALWQSVEDPQGRFDFEVISRGIYQVQVAVEGRTWVWSPEIDTEQNPKEPVAICLPDKKLASVRGCVVDEQGQPVSGARVLPLSKAGGLERGKSLLFVSPEGAVETGPDGRFTLDQLSPGIETLKVVHPDFAFSIVPGISLGEGTVVDERKITLKRGGTVEGHVYDVRGKPQAGTTLVVRDQESYGDSDEEKAGLLASDTTDAQGYYRVEHLPEQVCHILRAKMQNPDGVIHTTVLPVNGRTLTADLGGGNRVTGRLVDSEKPLSGHEVVVTGQSPHFGKFRSRLSTDSKGEFVFRGIPAGRHTVYAAIPGTRGDYVPLKTLDLKPSDTTAQSEIALGDLPLPTGRVSVSVVTEDSKPTTLTASVSVVEMMEDNRGRTAGNILPRETPAAPAVVTYLAPGRHAALVQLNPSLMQREYFNIEPGAQDQKVTIKTVKGTATLCGAWKLAGGARLNVESEDKRIWASGTTRDQRYLFERLPAGVYQIGLDWGITFIPVKTVTLTEGETKNLDIEGPEWVKARNVSSVVVNIFDGNGLSLSGSEAWLEGNGETLRPANSWNMSHTFSGQPGDYTLHVRYPGYKEQVQAVRIPSWQKPDGPRAANKPTPSLNVSLERE